MKINTNLMSLIIAVIALISPAITTIINCIFQLHIKNLDKQERTFSAKIKPIEEVYNGYLSSLGEIIALPSRENRTEYGKFYPLVLLYISSDKREIFQTLDADIMVGHHIDHVDSKYNQVVDIISNELSKLYKLDK
jgi:hypothetical protein